MASTNSDGTTTWHGGMVVAQHDVDGIAADLPQWLWEGETVTAELPSGDNARWAFGCSTRETMMTQREN